MLLYYFLGGLFMFLLARELGRARRGRAARRRRRSCSRPTWWRWARTATAASSWTRPTCRSCCGSPRAGCGAAGCTTSAGSRWPAASSCCAATCRSASTPGSRSALYAGGRVGGGAARRPRASCRRSRCAPPGVGAAAALAFGIAGFYNLPLHDYARYSIRGGGDGRRRRHGLRDRRGRWRPTSCRRSWCRAGRASAARPTGAGCRSPTTRTPTSAWWRCCSRCPAFLARRRARASSRWLLAAGRAARLVRAPLPALRLPLRPPAAVQQVPRPGDGHHAVPARRSRSALAWGWSARARARERGRRERARRAGPACCSCARRSCSALALRGRRCCGQDAWRDGLRRDRAGAQQRPAQADPAPRRRALAYRALRRGDLGARLRCSGCSRSGARVAGARAAGCRRRWRQRRCVLVLLLFELWPVSARVMEPVIGDVVAARPRRRAATTWSSSSRRPAPPGTLPHPAARAEFQSNRFAGFGIASLGGYHAAKPRLFQDLARRRR